MEGSGNSESAYDQGTLLTTPYYTPYQKQGLQTSDLKPVSMDLSPSSGGDSSVVSSKVASRSLSSSSSSSTESESFDSSVIRHHLDDMGLPKETKLKELSDLKQQNHTDLEDSSRENGNYEDLLRKFIKNEEELRVSNLKLELSEKEIISLKTQIKKSEGQLDHVQEELKMREADLEYERGQVLELQKQTADLETHVPDCSYKIAKLVEELEVAREQLNVSNDEIARLQEELTSKSSDGTRDLQDQLEVAQEKIATLEAQLDSGRKQIQELEDKIILYEANEAKHELQVQNLEAEMLDAQAQISSEKNLLQSDIVRLSEEKLQMDSKLKELELKSNSLENKLKECEAEKLRLEEMHANQRMVLEGEISSLKEELGQRKHDIEALNKEFDRHKQKYDMLMTEKDEANATIHKLMAEVSFRDNQIENKERELSQLRMLQAELVSGSEARLNLVNELKQKVEELKEEVARQNAVISDRAEEKREVIRQLCFSIEHYRSGYEELLQAFTGHKRHAVVAS